MVTALPLEAALSSVGYGCDISSARILHSHRYCRSSRMIIAIRNGVGQCVGAREAIIRCIKRSVRSG